MNVSRVLFLGAVVLLLGGCASQGKVANTFQESVEGNNRYSLETFQEKWRTEPNALMLTFSGGGTRAAALSYGVLKELRDIRVPGSESNSRLLDEIHSISSVSGGSFTSAYYGLHGDQIFEDYEEVFLRQNVQGALIHRLFNPVRWFDGFGRTEMVVDYYEKTVFNNATFADLLRADGPLIIINASDFARGVRFSFIQDYFDLLCSDLSSFPIARAVTASSAVPVLFAPVILENYSGCGSKLQDWLREVEQRVQDQPELADTVDGLVSYSDHVQRRYIHFVDGGITDNLGLRALYELVELSGGLAAFAKRMNRTPPRRLVLISVNAAADAQSTMDHTTRQPSIAESINAVSNVQLHRFSADTIALLKKSLNKWAAEVSTPEHPVEPYFIMVDFNEIKEPERREFFNQMPTSFTLTDEQVDALIAVGGELLRNNPEFRRLMADLATDARD